MSSIFDPTASGDKLQPAALAVNLGTNIGLSLITLGAFCWLRPRNGGNFLFFSFDSWFTLRSTIDLSTPDKAVCGRLLSRVHNPPFMIGYKIVCFNHETVSFQIVISRFPKQSFTPANTKHPLKSKKAKAHTYAIQTQDTACLNLNCLLLPVFNRG